MALLGNGGILELSREWPEPMALAPEAVSAASGVLALGNADYWTGDRVVLAASGGLPIDLNGDGYADCPEGHGIYFGSTWERGPARIHVTASSSGYYQATNTVAFYNTAATTGLTTITNGYISIDALDRIKLYSTEIAAHNSNTSAQLTLRTVKTTNLVVARYSAVTAYTNAVTTAANSISALTLPSTTQTLDEVITLPSALTSVADDPEQRGWMFQADLQEWALDIDAANLDMTAIGETFGENTKALVRGAGSLQFLVDHRTSTAGQDSLAVLRLVLLTQQGCKSNAKFWLYQNRDPNCGRIGGSVYYQCDLLLTNSRVNTRADSLIAGSSDFVVTGEIAIKVTA